jgi:hypothetical protein
VFVVVARGLAAEAHFNREPFLPSHDGKMKALQRRLDRTACGERWEGLTACFETLSLAMRILIKGKSQLDVGETEKEEGDIRRLVIS